MARKQRNDVDYFPHPVSHGKKMFYLRDKYGNDGYTVWFMLLEELGKANYHYLDLKDEVQIMYLSAEFKVTELLLNEIIETLVKFGEFDSELWEKENILFNEKFVENISDAYKKRSNECIDKNSLRVLLTSKGRLKPPKSTPKPSKSTSEGVENTQTILNYTKLDNTKEDKKPKKSVFNFRKSLIGIGVNEKVAEDFMKVRKTKKATDTQTAFNQLEKEIEKSGKSANECILISVENSWKGFKSEWVENKQNKTKKSKVDHVHVEEKKSIQDYLK